MHHSPILIENAEVYSPARLGRKSILCLNGKIVAVENEISKTTVDELARFLRASAIVIDAKGHSVFPGLVDPHQHLTGGSGEDGFATQTPSITLDELIEGGITTVVGCVGVDTYTQNLPHLFGRVRALCEEGISAHMYTGGYDVPPKTLTGDLRTDLLIVREVIGIGETAIADLRSTQPSTAELVRIVSHGRSASLLTGKCGITHFHVGDEKCGLGQLREMLDQYDIRPEFLYPTHVERTPSLLKEAADITHRGVPVDMDTCEEETVRELAQFI
ncbi:MAG: beta-aspartyl-peptidase, partial [Proteobacteria bacterium]